MRKQCSVVLPLHLSHNGRSILDRRKGSQCFDVESVVHRGAKERSKEEGKNGRRRRRRGEGKMSLYLHSGEMRGMFS